METYILTQPASTISLKQKSRYGLIFGTVFALLMFGFHRFWQGAARPHVSLGEDAIVSLISGILVGTVTGFGWRPKRGTQRLLVDEDSMTAVWEPGGLINWRFRSSVHRGKVRLFKEFKTKSGELLGLMISERGEIASRLFCGFVFVPGALPEYEHLKRLAENWRVSGSD